MAYRNRVRAIPVTFLNAAALGAYQPINPGGLPDPCFLLRIVNDSNTNINISYDGVTDHDFLPDGQTLQLQTQSPFSPAAFSPLFPRELRVSVSGVVGVGTIYLIGYFLESI